MATGNADALFLDTNVLVYANVAGAPLHAEALETIRSGRVTPNMCVEEHQTRISSALKNTVKVKPPASTHALGMVTSTRV